MINLCFVQPKNKLKIQKYNTELMNLICDKIKEIDSYSALKLDHELLKFVCDCIENGVNESDKKNKTDKKQLCIDVYTKVFTLSESEKVILSNSIEFPIDKKLITKFNTLQRCGSILVNYIKSKV